MPEKVTLSLVPPDTYLPTYIISRVPRHIPHHHTSPHLPIPPYPGTYILLVGRRLKSLGNPPQTLKNKEKKPFHPKRYRATVGFPIVYTLLYSTLPTLGTQSPILSPSRFITSHHKSPTKIPTNPYNPPVKPPTHVYPHTQINPT